MAAGDLPGAVTIYAIKPNLSTSLLDLTALSNEISHHHRKSVRQYAVPKDLTQSAGSRLPGALPSPASEEDLCSTDESTSGETVDSGAPPEEPGRRACGFSTALDSSFASRESTGGGYASRVFGALKDCECPSDWCVCMPASCGKALTATR